MLSKKLAKKIFLVVLGQAILGLGIGFILFAKLGNDPLSVFHSGVAHFFKISFGSAMFYENLIVLIAIYFIDKNYISLATVLSLFLIGYTADFLVLILNTLIPFTPVFIVRVLFILIGNVVLATGLNIYILAGLGVGALDAIAEIISDKSKYEYKTAKMSTDLLFLGVGFWLGGEVGLATVITAFIMGPIIQFIRERISKPIKSWIN